MIFIRKLGTNKIDSFFSKTIYTAIHIFTSILRALFTHFDKHLIN